MIEATLNVIIAGGRDFNDAELFAKSVELILSDPNCEYKMPRNNIKILHGACPSGADRLADLWATACFLPIQEYPADWDKYGLSAGPLRNEQMARNANMLIAFWDGKSRGTRSMINSALKHGLEVHVFKYGEIS